MGSARRPAGDPVESDHVVKVGTASARAVPCRGCGRKIVFWRSAVSDHWLPLEVGFQVLRGCVQEGDDPPTLTLRGVNHFVTCPKRDTFRRNRTGGTR